MVLRFEEWLDDQQDREDFIGDFARVLLIHDTFHKGPARKAKVDEHRSWADVVIRMVRPQYIDAFNEAWQEFLLARQAAAESTAAEIRISAVKDS